MSLTVNTLSHSLLKVKNFARKVKKCSLEHEPNPGLGSALKMVKIPQVLPKTFVSGSRMDPLRF